jgi:hypothetical protein
MQRGLPTLYLFGSTESERQRLRKSLYKLARSSFDSLTSVVVDPFEFPDLMDTLGLEHTVFPAGAVHQLSEDRIFHYPRGRPLRPDTIQRWWLDIHEGRIEPWTRPDATENIPGGHDEL